MAVVRLDSDLEIEGALQEMVAAVKKLQDGDVVVRVDGQECNGWPEAAIKAAFRRIKTKETDAKGVTITLRRRTGTGTGSATNTAAGTASGTPTHQDAAGRRASGFAAQTDAQAAAGAGGAPAKGTAAAAVAAPSSQWKLVQIDGASPPLDDKGSVCQQDDPQVTAVYGAWTDNPARHAALRGWFGSVLSGAAFADGEATSKVELKALSMTAIKGFIKVVLPLLLHDAPMLELECYLRRASKQPEGKEEEELQEEESGGSGSGSGSGEAAGDNGVEPPVLMDMRLFVSPKFM